MSAVFLFISSTNPHEDLIALAERSSTMLPFVPAHSMTWHAPDGRSILRAWSIVPQASRGGWWHQSDDTHLVYDGWWVEPDDAPTQTMAHTLQSQLNTQGWDRTLLDLEGEYSILTVHHSAEGTLANGGTNREGSRHLYYGNNAGVSVMSNRAFLAASALNDGQLPSPDPLFLSWLMSSIAIGYRNQTAWPHIKLAGPYDCVRILNGQLSTYPRPHDDYGSDESFDAHAQALTRRVGQVTRWPDLPRAMALTGGKDSRAVLAGLVAGGHHRALDYAYIRAVDAHPDAIVAKQLAEHYDIPFRRIDPIGTLTHDFFEHVDLHNIQTECGLHAWDLKGAKQRDAKILLHGNLGELLRSHALPKNLLGLPGVLQKYSSDGYADPNNVMTPMATSHFRDQMMAWVRELLDDGVRPLHLHDRIHRDARMHRWIGQTQLFDGLGTMGINPLTSRPLLNRYIASSYLDQRRHRIHFELIRRGDPWLVEQPFANARWDRLMVPRQPRSMTPVQGKTLTLSKQWDAWTHHQLAIRDNLLHVMCAEFDDIFSKDKVTALFTKMEHKPDTLTLKSIFGLLGIKRALTTPLTPRPFTMETPHDA